MSDSTKFEVVFFTTTLDYTKLNDYVGIHKIRLTSEIGVLESSGGARDKIITEFTLEVKSFCTTLLIIPNLLTVAEFGVYEPLKT